MSFRLSAMDLKEAQEILKKKCSDYRKYHDRVTTTLNLPETTPLKSYFEQVKNDPVEWFNAFPMDCASKESLAKPKTAILHLLEKNDKARAECGAEFCDSLAALIHSTWRENMQRLLEVRKAAKEQINMLTENASDTSEENEKSIDITDPVERKIVTRDTTKARTTQNTKDTSALASEIASLKEENKELADAIEQATLTIQSLQKEKQEMERVNTSYSDEIQRITTRFEMLKNLLTELMKDKGATDIEIKILERLLPNI